MTLILLGALLLAGSHFSHALYSVPDHHPLARRDQGVCYVVKPLGCYAVDSLSSSPFVSGDTSLQSCSSRCSGHVYFGVENGDEVSVAFKQSRVYTYENAVCLW